MSDLTEKLTKLRESITAAKEKKSRVEGKIQSELERLTKDFKCSALDEAQELLKQMEKERAKKEKQLEEEIDELSESL